MTAFLSMMRKLDVNLFFRIQISHIDCFPIHNQLKIEENDMDRHWIIVDKHQVIKKINE